MRGDSRAGGAATVGIVLLLAVAAIAFGGWWIDRVVMLHSSSAVPSTVPDIRDDYTSGILWALFLSAGVFAWGAAVRFQGPLMVVWIAKVVVALGAMLLYDYTYGVDPDGFFNNASMPGFRWEMFQFGGGTHNMQVLAWLHFKWVSSSFHASRLTFALIGLIAIFLVYRAGTIIMRKDDRRLFYGLALMPSILFWSSTLGKDPVTLFGVAAYTYGIVAWQIKGQSRYLFWVAAGLVVGVGIRAWLGPILLVPLIPLGLLSQGSHARNVAFVGLGGMGILLSPLVLESTIGIDPTRPGELIGAVDSMSRSFQAGGSTQDIPGLATFADLSVYAPWGMFTMLLRPLPGEVPNLFGTLAGLENALLLCLALRAVWRAGLRDMRDPLVMWALLAVLLWALVYSVHSAQNLGTAARHRLHIMPLFLGLLLYLGRVRRPSVKLAASTPVPRGSQEARMRPLV